MFCGYGGFGYGFGSPLLLILLFIGVFSVGRRGFGGGYGGASCYRGGCVSRSYGRGKKGCYSYSSYSGGFQYGFRRRNSRLILFIILLFLYGGCFGGGFGGFGY